jgi:SAM-dependent methyltransferase
MHEILGSMKPGARVLDLGCASGSFPVEATLAGVVRVDREAPKELTPNTRFVQGDAAALPFADGAFDAVISNHSLEHFADLRGALREMGRVIRPGGSLFVAVPDASTFTDKLYRWLARGGGHLNAFTSPAETAALIERATGLNHQATRILCSSLSFLNRCNAPRPRPRRLLLVGGGYAWSLRLYIRWSRRLDYLLKTRLSVYGWAFYFGSVPGPIDTTAWTNVCIGCGSGASAARLEECRVRKRAYRCPQCGAINPLV